MGKLFGLGHLKNEGDGSSSLTVSGGNRQSQAAFGLGEGNFCFAVQHTDSGNFSGVWNENFGFHGFLGYRVETNGIDLPALLGKGEIAALVGSADSGSVDGFAVGLHPLTESIETLACIHRDPAVPAG